MDEINIQYCNEKCSTGAAGESIGYFSSGTCLDYVYDELNADLAFAWEIYMGCHPINRKSRCFEDKLAFI